jgi:uncharacterized protein YhdP
MIEVAKAINTFGISAKADFESPSEEAVFIKVCQLQEIITKALQPLQDEVRDLKVTVARQDEKIATLEDRIALQEDNGLIQLRLINDLREATAQKPQPMQKNRGEILRALLAANNGKMLAKDARQKMHLSESRFSELLAVMQEYIDTKPYHLNKSAKILILK